jgi:hypothetical protein
MIAAALLAAAIYVLDARRYIGCEDLLGASAATSAQCNRSGSSCTVTVSKADLSGFSGPIRQLYEGQEQVTVNGYELHRNQLDHDSPEEPGSTTVHSYLWYTSQPGRGMILMAVFEKDGLVVVHVTHQDFGFWHLVRTSLRL